MLAIRPSLAHVFGLLTFSAVKLLSARMQNVLVFDCLVGGRRREVGEKSPKHRLSIAVKPYFSRARWLALRREVGEKSERSWGKAR